jgi:hypothetical protein
VTTAAMLRFNTLLSECQISPKTVQLVRHQDRGPAGKTPYSLWRTSREQFEAYQSLQGRPVFKRDWIAAFVVAPNAETLFVGLYRNTDIERTRTEMQCPISNRAFSPGKMWIYRLTLDDRLRELSARLTVEWGTGYRSWVQRADRQDKTIIELRKQFQEPDFPGFNAFTMTLGELAHVYESWKSVLSAVRGVYLLTFDDGQQYIGSASGDFGFFQRWQDYLLNGHGGNVALKGRDARLASVSVLETVGMRETREDIIAREMLWKRKLGTRAVALDEVCTQTSTSLSAPKP